MRLVQCLLAIIATLLVLGAAGPATSPAIALSTQSASQSAHLQGDANCNDVVDAVDGLQILESAAGLQPTSCLPLGNVNCDSATDALDVIGILRFAAGLPTSPVNGCPAIGSASMRLVTIDKFGGGAVTGVPSIACSAGCTTMSLAFTDGSQVNLTATPDPGSHLDKWTGCDSSSSASCSLTLNADKSAFATFAFDQTVIPSTTKVLDDATLALLLRVDGSTYYFAPSAAHAADLHPGDVIVSASNGGLLRKVVSVSLGSSEIAVTTADATLEDTIQQGSLTTEGSASASTAVAHPAGGVSCTVLPFNCSVPLDAQLSDAVNVSGSLSFDANPDVSVSFSGFDAGCLCFPVQEARAVLNFDGQAQITATVGKKFSTGAHTSIPVATEDQVVFIGAVPVLLTYNLSVEVGVTGSAQGSLASSVTIGSHYLVGGHYVRGRGWNPVNDFSRTLDFQAPQFALDAEAKFYVKPVVSVKVYGVVGPEFSVEGYVKGRVAPLETPWWTLSAGIGADAGFKAKAFGLTLVDYNVPLFEYEWVLAMGHHQCSVSDPSFCDFVSRIASDLASMDYENFLDQIEFVADKCTGDTGGVYSDPACDGEPVGSTVYCSVVGTLYSEAFCYRRDQMHPEYLKQLYGFAYPSSPALSAILGSDTGPVIAVSTGDQAAMILGVEKIGSRWTIRWQLRAMLGDCQVCIPNDEFTRW